MLGQSLYLSNLICYLQAVMYQLTYTETEIWEVKHLYSKAPVLIIPDAMYGSRQLNLLNLWLYNTLFE